jgi:hypothetical protein
MMPVDPMPSTSLGTLGWPGWADSPDCPACAGGWHGRCRRAELADDGGSGELVERCCDGLLIARLWGAEIPIHHAATS